MNDKISSLDLKVNDVPVPFVIRSLEEVDHTRMGDPDEPHRHNYYTVIWTHQASGKHIIDFHEYIIEPQQIFFVSPWQVHQVLIGPKPKGFVFMFTPEFLQKNSIKEDFILNLKLFRNSDETPPLPISSSMSSTLIGFASGMYTAYKSDDEMRYDTIGAFLKLFLITCNSHCSLTPAIHPQNLEVGRSILRNFKNLVEERFSEWHQVKEYAGVLHVTPNYLNEVIKNALNVSAKDYIQQRLTLEAKRMVAFTDKTVKEIGFDLGFEDPSHFSKFFKSHTGQSFQTFKDTITV